MQVALLLIDEVHLLNESRGAALEAGVVSRIKMVSRLPSMQAVRLDPVLCNLLQQLPSSFDVYVHHVLLRSLTVQVLHPCSCPSLECASLPSPPPSRTSETWRSGWACRLLAL